MLSSGQPVPAGKAPAEKVSMRAAIIQLSELRGFMPYAPPAFAARVAFVVTLSGTSLVFSTRVYHGISTK